MNSFSIAYNLRTLEHEISETVSSTNALFRLVQMINNFALRKVSSTEKNI